MELFERARASVPAPWRWPAAPERLDEIWWSQVAPSWSWFDEVLTRYAAAKVFASWSLYLGDGLDAAQAGRRGPPPRSSGSSVPGSVHSSGRPLDRELMTEAIRQSDLLLVHYADPSLLAIRRAPVRRIRPPSVHLVPLPPRPSSPGVR